MSRQKYLCMQRSIPGVEPGEKPSPAQMQEMYQQFNDWMEKYKNNLTDLGGRLARGKSVTTDGVKDGPFVESKELIGGYMIISADSLDEAIEVARSCPGLVSPGSGVEVREIKTP